jgi:hypothetical protein
MSRRQRSITFIADPADEPLDALVDHVQLLGMLDAGGEGLPGFGTMEELVDLYAGVASFHGSMVVDVDVDDPGCAVAVTIVDGASLRVDDLDAENVITASYRMTMLVLASAASERDEPYPLREILLGTEDVLLAVAGEPAPAGLVRAEIEHFARTLLGEA